MRIAHRLAAVGGGIALALGGLVAVAPTADASAQDCYFYLLENHPGIDPAAAEGACVVSAEGGVVNRNACYGALREFYVPATIALEACRRAQV
ncbi:hypothetical protein [Streptomyces sp. SID3343]|uniref:hypothetical protein n=1 Tax=Streptomyces sp. SID3343 TaxID=2690260 RepID=UPI00136B91A1|nr:hypothetical protein [Streptomyces sp. SID3343]MYW03045.1 hypothetical protein [Streptomyces sp. SID3343]